MSVQPYHHYDDDHADISAVRLAELFGCMDGSYATTVAAHHGEQMDLIERSDIDSTTSWTSEEMQISNRMESTTRTLDAIACIGSKGQPHPAISEFCHLHLPAFIDAFRATAGFDGERPIPFLDDELGPDEHVWTLLYLIVKDPLFCRYIREHPNGPTFPLDAMAYMSDVLRRWSSCLKRDRDWEDEFCQPLLYAFSAIMSVLLSASHTSSFSPLPIDVLDSPLAGTLIEDMDDLERSLNNTPTSLTEDVTERIMKLKRAIRDLRDCLGKVLVKACHKEGCPGEALAWVRCERKTKGGKMCKAGGELFACARCRSVRYCSREHQKSHWKIHKETCREPLW